MTTSLDELTAANEARNLRNRRKFSGEQSASGTAAIENYIEQRDKLWLQLTLNNEGFLQLSSVDISLLKDRNDFIEAIFQFKKIIKSLFAPDRIQHEQQRTKICATFVEQLENETKSLIRQTAT